MRRVIYEVHAKIVNGNGTYSTVSGYPKVFDSTDYNNDTVKTERRAKAAYHAALADMYAQDGRQMQTAYIVTGDGNMRWSETDGAIAEVEPPVTEGEGE